MNNENVVCNAYVSGKCRAEHKCRHSDDHKLTIYCNDNLGCMGMDVRCISVSEAKTYYKENNV